MKNLTISILGCVCLILSAFLAGLYVGRGMTDGVETQIQAPTRETQVSTTQATDPTIPTQTPPTNPTETTPPTEAPTAPPTQAPTAAGKININTASAEELMNLPGIGEVYAKRIVEYRTTNGAFKTISDITKVDGIGKKRFEAIMDLISVGG